MGTSVKSLQANQWHGVEKQLARANGHGGEELPPFGSGDVVKARLDTFTREHSVCGHIAWSMMDVLQATMKLTGYMAHMGEGVDEKEEEG